MNAHTDPAKMTREQLIDRVDELEDRLEAFLRPTAQADPLRTAFGLTGQEARLLAMLADGKEHSTDALLSACVVQARYADGNLVKVVVSRIRRKLPAGVKIECIWGYGYRLVDEAGVVREAMKS